MRALVVDDAKVVRRILSEFVQELKFETYDAEDGLDALEMLKSIGPVELLLVDWTMPNMDGIAFIKEIRNRPEHAKAKIMMVTTENEMENVIQALDAGADEYIMKPFTKEAIAEKLAILGFARA